MIYGKCQGKVGKHKGMECLLLEPLQELPSLKRLFAKASLESKN